jgi:hypothetical protein
MNQTDQTTYYPFQNTPNQPNQDYVPFQDELLTNPNKDFNKWCEYCGANMRANCHAHARWCPYYCDDEVTPVPIGGGIHIMFSFLVIYIVAKKFFIKKC